MDADHFLIAAENIQCGVTDGSTKGGAAMTASALTLIVEGAVLLGHLALLIVEWQRFRQKRRE